MTAQLTCGCPGEPWNPHTTPCDDLATQEDLLCDWCRTRNCPNRTLQDATTDLLNTAQAWF